MQQCARLFYWNCKRHTKNLKYLIYSLRTFSLCSAAFCGDTRALFFLLRRLLLDLTFSPFCEAVDDLLLVELEASVGLLDEDRRGMLTDLARRWQRWYFSLGLLCRGRHCTCVLALISTHEDILPYFPHLRALHNSHILHVNPGATVLVLHLQVKSTTVVTVLVRTVYLYRVLVLYLYSTYRTYSTYSTCTYRYVMYSITVYYV